MHLFDSLEMNFQTGFKAQLEMKKQREEATKTCCVPVTGH